MHDTDPPKKSDPIAAAAPVHPLRVFNARAEARALLVAAGDYDAKAAIDELLDDAWNSGLADQVGDGVLFALIAAAFSRFDEARA